MTLEGGTSKSLWETGWGWWTFWRVVAAEKTVDIAWWRLMVVLPSKMVHCGRLAEDCGCVCTERGTAVDTHENVADQLRMGSSTHDASGRGQRVVLISVHVYCHWMPWSSGDYFYRSQSNGNWLLHKLLLSNYRISVVGIQFSSRPVIY